MTDLSSPIIKVEPSSKLAALANAKHIEGLLYNPYWAEPPNFSIRKRFEGTEEIHPSLRDWDNTDVSSWDHVVVVDITPKNKSSYIRGVVILDDPAYTYNGRVEPHEGFAKVSCSFNIHNGNFIEDLVIPYDSDMFEIIYFMVDIINYQPEVQPGVSLDYIRIPKKHLKKWFIPDTLRSLNMRKN